MTTCKNCPDGPWDAAYRYCPMCGEPLAYAPADTPPPPTKARGRQPIPLGTLRAAVPENWTKRKVAAAMEWAEYKQTLPPSKAICNPKGWGMTLKRMDLYSAGQVEDMITKAIANGWQGWEHVERGKQGSLQGGVAQGAPKKEFKPMERPEDPVDPGEAMAALANLKKMLK